MRYSVFNKSCGDYSIYESRSRCLYRPKEKSSMGSSPEDVSPVIPGDAVLIKRSQVPEGTIVEVGYTVKGFVQQLAIVVTAILIAKYFFKG